MQVKAEKCSLKKNPNIHSILTQACNNTVEWHYNDFSIHSEMAAANTQ